MFAPKRTTILAAFTTLALSFAAAPALAVSDNEVSEFEAKTIVSQHLRKLGFTRTGESQLAARVSSLELVDGNWKATVRYGGHLPHRTGFVVVDAETGEITAPLEIS